MEAHARPDPLDPVDEFGEESFPASDPPSSWAGDDAAPKSRPDLPAAVGSRSVAAVGGRRARRGP